MHKLIVFLCLLSSVAFAQIHLEGKCELTTLQGVNFTALTGDWHQQKRINEAGSVDGSCLSLHFSINKTTGENRFTTISVQNRTRVSRNATITIKDISNSTLNIVYTDGITYDMVVQATDYLNYVIIHGCSGNDTAKSVYGQVYTREPTVPAAVTTAINNALKANTDFSNATWNEVSHSKEACETDSGMNLQASSVLFLIVGLVLAKDM